MRASRVSRVNHRVGFGERQGERFLAERMHTRPRRGDDDFCMRHRRRCNDDTIDNL